MSAALLIHGDARSLPLADASVHTVVTSPPYFALRCYGVDGQIGLEGSLAEYLETMVAVFREVRRVLRPDGICWANIGDTYAGAGYSNHANTNGTLREEGGKQQHSYCRDIKPKNLCLVPQRLAIALQEDGWFVRSQVIWAKPNPLPGSQRDRPTSSYEPILMLTKSARYYFDQEGAREPHKRLWDARNGGTFGPRTVAGGKQRALGGTKDHKGAYPLPNPGGRNQRDVWTFPTQALTSSRFGVDVEHFAAFPEELVRRCLASAPREVCGMCGAPWRRVTAPAAEYAKLLGHDLNTKGFQRRMVTGYAKSGVSVSADYQTLGWEPTCTCGADMQPSVVLDPFCGSGTVGVVARETGRRFVGVDLNPDYLRLAAARIGHGGTGRSRPRPDRVPPPAQLSLLRWEEE